MGDTKHTSFSRVLPYLIFFQLSIKPVSNIFTYYKAISILRNPAAVTCIIMGKTYFIRNVNKSNRNFQGIRY